MRQRSAIAGKLLARAVADARFGTGAVAAIRAIVRRTTPDELDIVHCANRILSIALVVNLDFVVVLLFPGDPVQHHSVTPGRSPDEADTSGFIGVIHRFTTTTTTYGASGQNARGVRGRRGCIALVAAATHTKAQHSRQNWSGQINIEGAVITMASFRLGGIADSDRATPLLGVLAGNNVDDTTRSVGTLQGGRQPANHFDAFDGIQWRNMIELVVTEVVGIDVAMVILPLAIDQDQRVIGTHTAHGRWCPDRLYRGFHRYPRLPGSSWSNQYSTDCSNLFRARSGLYY